MAIQFNDPGGITQMRRAVESNGMLPVNAYSLIKHRVGNKFLENRSEPLGGDQKIIGCFPKAQNLAGHQARRSMVEEVAARI